MLGRELIKQNPSTLWFDASSVNEEHVLIEKFEMCRNTKQRLIVDIDPTDYIKIASVAKYEAAVCNTSTQFVSAIMKAHQQCREERALPMGFPEHSLLGTMSCSSPT